ncbi:LytR/AlgR family response regulator transcription factor [Propionivibrio sp.]|uniref:LytR/AlgR family response regulator transcription factor n=1 Tax=Propionivibrio sp. TaxID=2212460 RepID=UPI0039E38F27
MNDDLSGGFRRNFATVAHGNPTETFDWRAIIPFFHFCPQRQSMIRIAICDDVSHELRDLVALTEQYLSINGVSAEITGFIHPDALLTAIEAMNFHLYVLDIAMPMVSGLELGREIRRLDCEAQIIYATTEPQFALQAYAANPAGYLVKPIDRLQLFDVLAFAIARADSNDERTFTVKTADSLRVINVSNIVCCEYRNHAAVFSVANGEKLVSRTFRESFPEYCARLLNDTHFVQCHAAFLINMRRVESFTRDSFTLHGGKLVPIASKRYPAVRDAYMDYLTANGKNR